MLQTVSFFVDLPHIFSITLSKLFEMIWSINSILSFFIWIFLSFLIFIVIIVINHLGKFFFKFGMNINVTPHFNEHIHIEEYQAFIEFSEMSGRYGTS